MAKRPMVASVNLEMVGPNGNPLTLVRPMRDDEYAQWQTDQAATVSAPAPAKPPLERLADHLAALGDKPVTAADLLASLRPDADTKA